MAISKITSSGLAGDKYNVMTAGNNYYEPLASTLLTASTATITFSNIPQTYKHLQIRGFALGTAAASGPMSFQLNGDASANYAAHLIVGKGTGVGETYGISGITYGRFYGYNDNISNTLFPLTGVLDILDYANTTKNKTITGLAGMDKNGAATGEVQVSSTLWMSTASVTSISVYILNQNMATNTRWSLYGIKG